MIFRQTLLAAALSAVIASLVVLALDRADEPAAPAKPDRIAAPAAEKAVTERWTNSSAAVAAGEPKAEAPEALAPRDSAPEIPQWANVRQPAIANATAPAFADSSAAAPALAEGKSATPRELQRPQRANAAAAKKRESFAPRRSPESRSRASGTLGYYYEIAGARGYGEERVKRACVPGLRMPQVCYYPQATRRHFPVRIGD
jgi:hypothetical protein